MMGRTLRGASKKKDVPIVPKRQTESSSENSDMSDDVINKNKIKTRSRTAKILGDHTNNKSSPTPEKRPRLVRHGKSSSSVQNQSSKVELKNGAEAKDNTGFEQRGMRTRRALLKVLNDEAEICNTQPTAPTNKGKPVKSIDEVVVTKVKKQKAAERTNRAHSLKENESETTSIASDVSIEKRRPQRRLKKEENIKAILEESSEDDEPLQKIAQSNTKEAFKESTFYGTLTKQSPSHLASKVPIYKSTEPLNGSPKICVYKMNKEKKTCAVQDRLALYEFEVDSSEEPVPIKKKRKAKPQKAKSKPKAKPVSKTVSHGVKKNPVTLASNSLPVRAVVIAKLPAKVPNKNATPVKKPEPLKKNILVTSSPEVTTPENINDVTNIEYQSSMEETPLGSMQMVKETSLSQAVAPLQNLFDDEDTFNSLNVYTSGDNLRPTRFEYNELVKARARMQARKINMSSNDTSSTLHKPIEDKEKDTSRLRQTSMKNYILGGNSVTNSTRLFATGSRVENDFELVSSTPQRPGMGQPALLSLLSPVPLSSPTVSFLKSPNKEHAGQSPCTFVESPPRIVSPPKLLASPAKSEVSPAKKQNTLTKKSPAKFGKKRPLIPKPMPTRLSIETLRNVVKLHPKTELAPPLLDSPGLEPFEDIAVVKRKDPPLSPQRSFTKPPRKSYERKRVQRLAPNFMELEEEDHLDFSEDDSADEIEEKVHTKAHRKQKENPEKAKAFEDWASRFNSELHEVEDFKLNVE